MMAALTLICFVFLCGFTNGHPAADDIKSKFLVNGQENEPRMEYDTIETPTQINGIGDEPVEDSPKQGEGPKMMVNGKENEQRLEYDSIETPTQINGIGDEPVQDIAKQDPSRLRRWFNYTSYASWCTGSGRSLISSDTTKPISVCECQKRCMDERPGCNAVEFWEKYNYACFECTDLAKVTAYTNQNDLSYPVYVWVKAFIKYKMYTSWCTSNGRSLISSDTTKPISVRECQRRCMDERPGCKAVEFWEKYNYACFECTDLAKVTAYTYENDLAYPVYVWVKGLKQA